MEMLEELGPRLVWFVISGISETPPECYLSLSSCLLVLAFILFFCHFTVSLDSKLGWFPSHRHSHWLGTRAVEYY